MGVEASRPATPAYQPSFLEQHVKSAGALQAPTTTAQKKWQGKNSMGADAWGIQEAKRAQDAVSGGGRDTPGASMFGNDSWLAEHFRSVTTQISDTVVHKPNQAPAERPHMPADSWLMSQAIAGGRDQALPRRFDFLSAQPPPSLPADGRHFNAQPPTGGADAQAKPPPVLMSGKTLVTNPQSLFASQQEKTESDRSLSSSASDLASPRPSASASDDSYSEPVDATLQLPPAPDLPPSPTASAPSTASSPAAAAGPSAAPANAVTGQSVTARTAAKSVFAERMKTMKAMQTGGGSAATLPTYAPAGAPAAAPGQASERRGSGDWKFPWSLGGAAKGGSHQSNKDVYRMGLYDRQTSNVYGVAPEVVRATDNHAIYQGIDAEIQQQQQAQAQQSARAVTPVEADMLSA